MPHGTDKQKGTIVGPPVRFTADRLREHANHIHITEHDLASFADDLTERGQQYASVCADAAIRAAREYRKAIEDLREAAYPAARPVDLLREKRDHDAKADAAESLREMGQGVKW